MSNTNQHLFTRIEIHRAQWTRDQAQAHKDLPDELALKILTHADLLQGIIAIKVLEEDRPVLLVQGQAIVGRDIRTGVFVSLDGSRVIGKSGENFIKPAGLEWGCAVRGKDEGGQPESC